MQTNNEKNDGDVTLKNLKLEFSFEEDVENTEAEMTENVACADETLPQIGDAVEEKTETKQLDNVSQVKLGEVARTYVPCFTSVTEQGREKVGSGRPILSVAVSSGKTVDPTKELDGGVDSYAKVVAVNAPNEETYEIQSTVFKFDNEMDDEPIDPSPAVVEKKEREEPVIEKVSVAREPEEKIYTIPDPELGLNKITDNKKENTDLVPAPPVTVPQKGGLAFASEFTANAQRDNIKDKFLDSIMSVKVRLWATAALLAVLFFVENLWLFGFDVPGFLGIEMLPGNMALLDLHFTVALFALALPEFIMAIRKLAVGRAVPELFMGISAFAAIFYSVVVIIKAPLTKYPLFGAIFGIMAICAIISSLYKKNAEFVSFKAISSHADKSVVDRKLTRTLPEENHALDGKIQEYKSKIARVQRTEFVSDFFKRSGKCSENSRGVATLFFGLLGAALVSGIVAFFVASNSIYHASMVFALVVMLGLPAFSLLLHKIPYFHACCEARVENSALIGETALHDYAGVDVLTFRDTEIFSDEDVTLQRIMLYGKSENLEKAMHQMSAIFAVVGGPLETMFLDAIDRKAPRARNITIEEDGIIGEVGGCEVRAGSLEYMRKNGISIPDDNTKESSTLLSTKIMYAAENGEVYAKFYIRYTLSEDFTMILPVLLDDGITPLVYTKDPNISNELFKNLTAGADNIRVVRRFELEDDEETVRAKTSAGLVTTGDKLNVINMLILSKKYERFQKRMSITEFSAAIVGSVLAVIFSLTGMTAIPSVVLAFWQTAWCVALLVMSKRTITEPNFDSKDKK